MINKVLDTVLNYINNLNDIKLCLHNISPFRHDPVDCVLWVPLDDLSTNDYNPNTMALQEKKLLKYSVDIDGFTQLVVAFSAKSDYGIVDGFHHSGLCRKRNARFTSGYVPITLIGCSSSDKCRH